MPRYRRGALALLVAVLLPLGACAEGGDAEAGAATIPEDADPQQLLAEFQRIQAQLGEIQEQALQDPELEADRQALERRLDAEMEALDPEAPAKQARQEVLAAEFQAAQEAGEEETARELVMENQQLQEDLQQTRDAALQTQEMTAAIESFQEDMLAAMNEVDARTDSLLARAEAIIAFLQQQIAQPQTVEQTPPEAEPDTP